MKFSLLWFVVHESRMQLKVRKKLKEEKNAWIQIYVKNST